MPCDKDICDKDVVDKDIIEKLKKEKKELKLRLIESNNQLIEKNMISRMSDSQKEEPVCERNKSLVDFPRHEDANANNIKQNRKLKQVNQISLCIF